MNQYYRTSKTTSVFTKILVVGLFAGIVYGAFLGIPAFVNCTSAWIGDGVNALLENLLRFEITPAVVKVSILGFFTLGGFGIFRGRIALFQKCVALFIVGTIFVQFLAMSPQDIAVFLLDNTVAIIGIIFWGVVNAIQLWMLLLKDDQEAVKVLLSRVTTGKQARAEGYSGSSPAVLALQRAMQKDKIGAAVSGLSIAGGLCYFIEIGVNIVYGNSAFALDWLAIVRPGGLAAMATDIVLALVVLIFTVGSIEFLTRLLLNVLQIRKVLQ